MSDTYNLYNLEASFKEYLLAGNHKPVSVKNYLSDIRHFFGWMIFKIKNQRSKIKDEELDRLGFIQNIKVKTINEYKSYLSENNIPHKTINRRLSTVRKFCSFCISQGWMKENPAKQISNIKSQISNQNILDQFRQDLSKEFTNQNTVNNYFEDVRDFLGLV